MGNLTDYLTHDDGSMKYHACKSQIQDILRYLNNVPEEMKSDTHKEFVSLINHTMGFPLETEVNRDNFPIGQYLENMVFSEGILNRLGYRLLTLSDELSEEDETYNCVCELPRPQRSGFAAE